MGYSVNLDYVNPKHLLSAAQNIILPKKSVEVKEVQTVAPQSVMSLIRTSGSFFIRIAGFSGASAVAMGAYGSHGFILDLRPFHISMQEVWGTGYITPRSHVLIKECLKGMKSDVKKKVARKLFMQTTLLQSLRKSFSSSNPKTKSFYNKPDIPSELKDVYRIANYYHFMHSLALLAVPLTRRPLLVGSLLITGMSIFCGTCYAYALTGNNSYAQFTPYGGTLLIVAWLSMMF